MSETQRSARASCFPTFSAPPPQKQGGSRVGRSPPQEEGEDGEDEAEGEEGVDSRRRVPTLQERSTFLIDGISELVGYLQIRELFAQIGRVSKVFVQRSHKVGRNFRFGFVHFMSKAHAEEAITRLNGTKLGGIHLSVTVARYPVSGSSSRAQGTVGKSVLQRGVSSVLQKGAVKGVRALLHSL